MQLHDVLAHARARARLLPLPHVSVAAIEVQSLQTLDTVTAKSRCHHHDDHVNLWSGLSAR